MNDGHIVRWLVSEGDRIQAGQPIFEMETDKAVMEVEAADDARIAKILVPSGKRNVGDLVALLVDPSTDVANLSIPDEAMVLKVAGKSVQDPPSSKDKSPPTPSPLPSAAPSPAASWAAGPKDGAPALGMPSKKKESSEGLSASGVSAGGVPRVMSPAAQNLLRMHNVDPSQVRATGPKGCLLKSDVLAFLDGSAPTPFSTEAPAAQAYTDIPLTNMRKIIAQRLSESKATIPHSYMAIDVDLAAVSSLRAQLKAQGEKVSVNDFIVRASARALRALPSANAQLVGGEPATLPNIDISIAVATPAGLITPIIFAADKKSILEISEETKALAARARANKLKPHEYQGGTFSISNLGMYGVREFSAVINLPQAAILAVGGARTVLVPGRAEDGAPVAASVLTAQLSYDERVISRETMAEWLDVFRGFMERPYTML